MDLHVIWFLLLGLLLAGYAVLDGFDFRRRDLAPARRGRIMSGGCSSTRSGRSGMATRCGSSSSAGALFAAFPEAYATVFSGFYMAFMMLLFALIFRAVSDRVPQQDEVAGWRRAWDTAFFGSSLLASLLFGVAVGNGMMGITLDNRGVYMGGFFDLLNPYSVLAGLVTIAMFAMHGALYLFLKLPEGEARDRVRGWMWHTWGIFLVLYMLGTMYTLVAVPRATRTSRTFRGLARSCC
jgi:cytochrome d ubiquinol oxidase subunit II